MTVIAFPKRAPRFIPYADFSVSPIVTFALMFAATNDNGECEGGSMRKLKSTIYTALCVGALYAGMVLSIPAILDKAEYEASARLAWNCRYYGQDMNAYATRMGKAQPCPSASTAQ